MGSFKVRAAKEPQEIRQFLHSLLADLSALEKMVDGGMLEEGVQRIGVEQELCLIDRNYHPAPIIVDLLKAIGDDHFTTELARFNLEFNLDPLIFAGDCFSKLEATLHHYLGMLDKSLSKFDARAVLTGILPTIRPTDLRIENMTPIPRYESLFGQLRALRGSAFSYHIRGSEELNLVQDFPTFEFCNTSFQIHFQPKPADFVDAYNFAKLITAPTLAASVNSPLLMGKRLWQETRIALFQQAIDTRDRSRLLRQEVARVSFARKWVHKSIMEMFRDDLARFKVLLITEGEEEALAMLAAGKIPRLQAFNAFYGTIYRWNRCCYGISNGKPHLRIENRVVPAGPTVIDQVANSAFWIGMMNGMPDEYRSLGDKVDFDWAVNNFTRAARTGLDATFYWMGGVSMTASELILKELLPIAEDGLKKAGIVEADMKKYLGVIRDRVTSRQTGAAWLLQNYSELRRSNSAQKATVAITAAMLERQKAGEPVHTWSNVEANSLKKLDLRFEQVGDVMLTELFTVHPEESLELVGKLMQWKELEFVLVEAYDHTLLGVITFGILREYLRKNPDSASHATAASSIMATATKIISPEAPIAKARELLKDNELGCLPVISRDKLVGLVTEGII